MIETDFHRREFGDGEELALGLADWTAERLRGGIAARGVALLPADVLQVPWNRAAIGKASAILAAHGECRHVRFIDWQQRLQHFQLFITKRVRFERIWWLHRNEAKKLHHVVLDHVAYGAGFLVVSASSLNTECLRDGNLYMINMRVVPHRL